MILGMRRCDIYLSNSPRPFTIDVYTKVKKLFQLYKKLRNFVVNKIRHSIRSYFSKLRSKLHEKKLTLNNGGVFQNLSWVPKFTRTYPHD